MESRIGRASVVVLAALLGFVVGCSVSASVGAPKDYSFLAEYTPLPHHVPEHKGGLSFRFAMVHDVIHDRFAKHGAAHYRERNRLTREKLTKVAPDSPEAFALADDLGAGLDRIGQIEEAVEVMRAKLARQEAKGLKGRDLYTSYANLGTFLIHASAPKAIAGDAAARERFREGVELIQKSVEVNPEAHFGRERWQAALTEFLLAAMADPQVLRTFDCLGNRLDRPIGEIMNRDGSRGPHRRERMTYGRATDTEFSEARFYQEKKEFFSPEAQPDDPASWEKLRLIREHITKIGAEEGWDAVKVPSHRNPVPFDEPLLGIIGIWRQGSGANPHFALTLGETMLRVGQRYISWAAYERAARLAGRFSPDPALQQFLRVHCRKRQGEIEETLVFRDDSSTRRLRHHHDHPPSKEEIGPNLRASFESELAYGEGYQKAYQQYEEEKIASGVPITDEHFFDAFHAGREPIESPTGSEEWFASQSDYREAKYRVQRFLAWGVFGAGLSAIAAALLMRWWPRSRSENVSP